jgi:hypothetical protein
VLAAVATARPKEVAADWQCYATVCGETWQTHPGTGCYGASPCFWGTWSKTYARWDDYILYMEIYGSHYVCTIICEWEEQSTYPYTVDSGGLVWNFESWWHYWAYRMNRAWTYHAELSTNTAGGNSSDGFCPGDAQLCE